MIDLHCHLDLYENPREVVRKSDELGLFVLSLTTTPSAFELTEKLSLECKRIKTALGLHPQIAHERYREVEIFNNLIQNVRYVGEIGLDGARDFRKHSEIQKKVFEEILFATGKSGGKVMSIHSRGAASETIEVLKKYPNSGIPIFHWFSGTQLELKEAISMGAWFSVNPLMLMSKKGQQLVSLMPRDRVLTETDGPFTKNDNAPFYPWDVSMTHLPLSKIWNISELEVVESLLSNLKALTTSSGL